MKLKNTLLIISFFIILFTLSSCYEFQPENPEFKIYRYKNGNISYSEQYLITDTTKLYKGDTVCFDANYAEYELWDFGNEIYDDGLFWYSPIGIYDDAYVYDTTGTFIITHTTFSTSMRKKDTYSQKIVIQNGIANLELLIEDEEAKPVTQANVILFGNYDDWYNDENPLDTLITDEQGKVYSENLEAKLYYVDVISENVWYIGYEIYLYRGNNYYTITLLSKKALPIKKTMNIIGCPKF